VRFTVGSALAEASQAKGPPEGGPADDAGNTALCGRAQRKEV